MFYQSYKDGSYKLNITYSVFKKILPYMGSVKVCLHSVQCEKKIENYSLADLLNGFPFVNVYLSLFNAIITFRVCILKYFFALFHVTKLLFHLFTRNLKVSLLRTGI